MRIVLESRRSDRTSREDKPHCLLDLNIAQYDSIGEGSPSLYELRKKGSVMREDRRENRGVLIEKGIENCNLHGDYVVRITIARDEIVKLARLAWNDATLAELVEALAESGGRFPKPVEIRGEPLSQTIIRERR